MSIVAPGTMRHVGEKTVHLAATNMTHGESKNTNCRSLNIKTWVDTVWKSFSEYVKSKKAMLYAVCKCSHCLEALHNDSENSTMGEALTRGEVKKMMVQKFRPELARLWPYQFQCCYKLIPCLWRTNSCARALCLRLWEVKTSPGPSRQKPEPSLRIMQLYRGRLWWWIQAAAWWHYGPATCPHV